MSRLDSELHLRTTRGIFFPHLGCDLVALKTEPLDVRLAIATDLLAQIEARHRAATRLQDAARQLSRGARPRASATPMNQLREQLRVMRDLFDTERALLDDLEREVSS
jgi:hypothetical protein